MLNHVLLCVVHDTMECSIVVCPGPPSSTAAVQQVLDVEANGFDTASNGLARGVCVLAELSGTAPPLGDLMPCRPVIQRVGRPLVRDLRN